MKLSSIEVVFHWSHLPLRSSSFDMSSIDVVFNFGIIMNFVERILCVLIFRVLFAWLFWKIYLRNCVRYFWEIYCDFEFFGEIFEKMHERFLTIILRDFQRTNVERFFSQKNWEILLRTFLKYFEEIFLKSFWEFF